MNEPRLLPARVPVLIAGGGPVGLTLAALLSRHGVSALVIEADASYCEGSRAICISRRSQEIMGWVGADAALTAKGLPWTGGRSYFRDLEVLHFQMPSDPTERFAPMVNIQQFYVEEVAHRAGAGASSAGATPADVRWGSRVAQVQQHAGHVDVVVDGTDGRSQTVRADWLVACDGGRSTVRDQSGLVFEGMQYEGRYVIVDIRQETQRSVERLAWFDPPSNPGSTILMHRQPDNVWRIDYQIADGEDPVEAIKPENVLPRVQSHLDMIGETAPWEPIWISIYNAKCLTLDAYRHGRLLFAGDAAHMVPIFGVRGLNSGLDDAGNLAWKLALVLEGANDALLDSYSLERVHATRQNIAYGAKSTEFMAPPHGGFKLMREAALRLAGDNEAVRSLINPRQSTPVDYSHSPLNQTSPDIGPWPRAGSVAPEAKLAERHLSSLFGQTFVALYFSDRRGSDAPFEWLNQPDAAVVALWRISRLGQGRGELGDGDGDIGRRVLHDDDGQAWLRYAASEGTLVLVRPDGYVLGRWIEPGQDALRAALEPFRRSGSADVPVPIRITR